MSKKVLIRLADVLERIHIGKTTWYKWIQKGIAPKGEKVGRTTFYDEEAIDLLVERIGRGELANS